MSAAARELLRDSFTRLIEHVDGLCDGLADDLGAWQPVPRCQDLQLCDIAGTEQVWTRDGWKDRFGLDLPGNDIGYGHTAAEVAKVRAPADLLAGYYHAVHKVTLEYIASIDEAELGRIVDEGWTPPVTASARLVSIIDDCAQHLGQAAYIKGTLRQS